MVKERFKVNLKVAAVETNAESKSVYFVITVVLTENHEAGEHLVLIYHFRNAYSTGKEAGK